MTHQNLKTYDVLVAIDVPHYGTALIEAETPDAALAFARELGIMDLVVDPGWENAFCPRVVRIEDPDGNITAEDIQLDPENALVLVGHPEKIKVCRAADDLLAVLNAAESEIERLEALSGCPADNDILLQIRAALRKAGLS